MGSKADFPEKDFSTTDLLGQEHNCEQRALLSRWHLQPIAPLPLPYPNP